MDHRHYKLPVARTKRLTRRTHRTVDDRAWIAAVWVANTIVFALIAWDLWGILLLHLE